MSWELSKGFKINEIKILKSGVLKNFEINFLDNKNNILPITVIAGINGTGKTTILEYIHKFYTHTDNILYLPANYSTELKLIEVHLIKLVKRYIFKLNYTPFHAYKEVSSMINNIFVNFDLKISFSSLDEEEKVYFENKKGESFPINQLSTGEKTLLLKILSLYLLEVKNSVILIDEPELSLHPNWQNRILDIYERFAIENNNQIIIATHSPHIVGSAKTDSLRVLYFEENEVKVVKDFTEGYGLEVNQILTKVMNIDSLRTPDVDILFSKVKTLIIENNYQNKEFEAIWKKLEIYLGKNNIDLKLLKLEIDRREKNV